jgi:hypothetical protein
MARAADPFVAQQADQQPQGEAEGLIDVTFDGGTVAAYIAALRKADTAANVVLIPPASDVQLPRVELRSASLNAAVYLLDGLAAEHPRGLAHLHVSSVDRRFPGESQIYTVMAQIPNAAVDQPGVRGGLGGLNAPIETRVWSIADLLTEEMKAEHVLSAIEGGLDLVRDDSKPVQLRFHADTGLIVAAGGPVQINMIHEVIHNLWEARQHEHERGGALASWQQAVVERDRIIEQIRNELAQAMTQRDEQVKELQGELARLRGERDDLFKESQRAQVEAHQLQLEIRNLQHRLDDAQNELKQLRERTRQP